MLDFDGTRKARRRDAIIAGVVVFAAFLLFVLPAAYQRPIRQVVRVTLLRPFLQAQATLVDQRARTVDVHTLRAQRDSLLALSAAQATLSEENQRLRALLGLSGRAGRAFVPADVLKLGVAGAESTFMLNVGSEQGVTVGSPVLAPEGLVGRIMEVQRRTSQAIDWTHPDFRASAMSADGQSYGIVEPRRGRYREEDLLALTGAPFHTDLQPGTPIVTSGRGGVFPRGIPLGVVLGIEEADTGWRKSYLVRPAVRPEAVTHVLVGLTPGGADLSELWYGTAPQRPDTTAQPAQTAERRATAGGQAGTQ